MAETERKRTPGRSGLAEAVARGYHKLLAYKDEYEVGRLYSSPAFDKALSEQFEGHRKLEFHLAPPLFARRDKETGEPRKMRFGRGCARCPPVAWARACAGVRSTSATRGAARRR